MIMDTAAEDPRTKANAFRVPPYDSQNWQIMRELDVFTIKEMVKAIAGDEGSTPPKTTKAKRGRNRKDRRAKSKTVVESDSTDSADDQPTKSAGGVGVKSSSKPKPQSSVKKKTKSIKFYSSLLMPEGVESRQREFDE